MLLMAVLPGTFVVLGAGPAQATVVPTVVPALRTWTAGSGTYTFTGTSRVVVDPAYAQALGGTASVFTTDLEALTGRTVASTSGGPAQVNPGDIYLTLGSTDPQLGVQGYEVSVAASVSIRAGTDVGAFYGTRTVLQMLSRSTLIPAGTARDWPSVRERSMSLDNGRKYFSLIWLRDHIRQLAYLKYNVLHLHLSDNEGFRLESSVRPEAVSPQHYTKAQIKELVDFAKRYHITVIPEVDMPSHMAAILSGLPHFSLAGNPGKLNLANPDARELAKNLVREYLPLFPGPVWHMGADEYLDLKDYALYPGLSQDVFLGFINEINQIVRASGKTLRIWNDGLFVGTNVRLSPDIQVDYWSREDNVGSTDLRRPSPTELMQAGHDVLNSNEDHLYYVLGRPDWKTDPANIYDNFRVDLFEDDSIASSRLLGTSVSVWSDAPTAESEVQVGADLLPSLQALAQVSWGSAKPTTDYAEFHHLTTRIGQAPGRDGRVAPTPLTSQSAHLTYWPSQMVDGNDTTWFWSSAAPTADDYVGVDLGTVQAISGVRVAMATADAPNDYLRDAVLEYSTDLLEWTPLGRFDQPTVSVATANGTSARYVRLRGTTTQPYWLIVREFSVTVRHSATLTTNLDTYLTHGPSNSVDGDTSTFFWSNAPATTGSYLALDFGVSREIGLIDVLMANHDSPRDHLHFGVLEYSNDGTTWTAMTFRGQNEIVMTPPAGAKARYVRIKSASDQTNWLVIEEFLVK